ncbi:MAG: GerW family sporulation protein [Clostridia bacterium]|nr:GerW family sporulation protein [Clostridia bacterium]
MSDNKIQAILDTTMEKLKAMVNADVITGEAIYVNDLTLIPVSKVAYGIVTGGSDFATKTQSSLFGGGSGAGVTVSPIAFMVIKGDDVKMIPIYNELTTIEKAINMAPEIIDKAKEIFAKDGDEKK